LADAVCAIGYRDVISIDARGLVGRSLEAAGRLAVPLF
jgi:hypothetical protein